MRYAKLRGLIKEKYGTESNFANAMNISKQVLSNKLNSKNGLRSNDVQVMANLLGIKVDEIGLFFFNE